MVVNRLARLFAAFPRGDEDDDVRPQAEDGADLREELRGLMMRTNREANRMPLAAVPQIRDIGDLLDRLLAYADAQRASGAPVDALSMATVASAVEDYLPTMIHTFLVIPTTGRPEDGPGAERLLTQLDALEGGLSESAEAIFARDLQRLDAHGRFLETKFGKTDLSL